MSYVKVHSWHSVRFVNRGGAVRTRCGLAVRVKRTIAGGQGLSPIVRPTSETLPLGEPSCEVCLRLTAHDAEPRP